MTRTGSAPWPIGASLPCSACMRAGQTAVAFAGGRGGSGGGFLVTSRKRKGQRKGGSEAVIARLRPKLARVTGATLFLNPVQDLRVGGRQTNATYQYTLQGQNLA